MPDAAVFAVVAVVMVFVAAYLWVSARLLASEDRRGRKPGDGVP